MLNLTKYKQKIIKALIAVANCLFVMQLKKIFKGKIQKIVLCFLAIFGLSLLFWQFHFKAVLSDANPPYNHATLKRQDGFDISNFAGNNPVLKSPIASETINVDRLGYKLTKLYYENGVDYFRCANATTADDLQYYCDKSLKPDGSLSDKSSQCNSSPVFCTEEQVFTFQAKKQESFYKRSPGEKIIRLVKEYKSGDTILTDYRINYLPPYDQFTGVSPTVSSGVLNALNPARTPIKVGINAPFNDYNGKVSNLPACKAGATLQDIGNTCMLKIDIDDTNIGKKNSGDFNFLGTQDYCHDKKDKQEPILGQNCRLPACLAISKEYYRRPGINCLADCNDTSDFNGIDDNNLKLPGINCLPACETYTTGTKVVNYQANLTTDSLLPKDIGTTCFLKHQGYVMPVCNNTPLANFPSDSNSQNSESVKQVTIASSAVPRKDCMNASDLPLCAFFDPSDRVNKAKRFGCLGMVKQGLATSEVVVDNEYVLGTHLINKSTQPNYDENPASSVSLKSIPIINYSPQNCSSADPAVGCGKPYTYAKLVQQANLITSNYDFNVDMMRVQDASATPIDVLNHDSVNEGEDNSLRNKPFRNTVRNTSEISGNFSVDTSGYKILNTLASYYNATNKPSCSLLTKQELKFIGARNCDLNQIWSDTTGGKNSVADFAVPPIVNPNKNFCKGEYFCKVDTRCSMFSDEQLQEAKAFFHCLPAQYSKYEESKSDIQCNILNDFEILALTKTTKTGTTIELDELKNYITKACFRGNLAFLIHKRVDHNISATTDPNADNIPDYTKINNPVFYADAVSNASPPLVSQCQYVDEGRIDYMFRKVQLNSQEGCYHSSQFSCTTESYKKACYLLGNYKFNSINSFFENPQTSISDNKISTSVSICGALSNDVLKKGCAVQYALNTLATLNCFSDYANFNNTNASGAPDTAKITTVNKCDTNPLLLTVFVPNRKTIRGEKAPSLDFKPITSGNTDCQDCYCLPIDTSTNEKATKSNTAYLGSGGLAEDFTLETGAEGPVKTACKIAGSNCYICYKPNFYIGLHKKIYPPNPNAITYHPVVEFSTSSPSQDVDTNRSQENTSDMGYFQYEDPFYSWFFFPKPNTGGSEATQTVRDCGDNSKCYKAFTVDFPNSRGNNENSGFLNNADKGSNLDFFQYPPIYYYGNGNYGDDAEKEKYNLVSSKEGLNSGVINRIGTHFINKIASPSATALRGASMMGVNPYGNYSYTSSFDREWLCGMNRNVGGNRLPDENTFAYFAPVLVNSGKFGLKTNNVSNDPRRFSFSDTRWNDATQKLEYFVNICLRYESAIAPGACGRRECRIDNPLGMMHCGEDQCRKFKVEAPDAGSSYSKCHLLGAMADIDGKQQSRWFVNNLRSLVGETNPLADDVKDFLDNDGMPNNYQDCAKLYSAPSLEHGKKTGKAVAAAIVGLLTLPVAPITAGAVATSAIWDYTNHRVRAFYESGYICAELDFYGIDLATYNKNRDDMNNYSSFELPNGGKICYGGRVPINNGKDCGFANGGFNTFSDLGSGIGGLKDAPDPTVWRTVRKVKFVGNISDDANVEFLGYSVPTVATQSTHDAYKTSTNVANLFPAQMKAKDGLITMVYDHNARMSKLKSLNVTDENEIFKSHQDNRDTGKERSPDDSYGLWQISRGKKNPYYGFNGYYYGFNGFNGYRDGNDPTWNWLSTSYPDKGYSQCKFFGFIPIPGILTDDCSGYSATDDTKRREGGGGVASGSKSTSDLYRSSFQPNNFLKEKVWLKSDCVPVQKRVGFPLSSAVATPDNAPNLFSPEPIVFAVKTTSAWKKATDINATDSLNVLDFSDPEIVLKYGSKYYYVSLPRQHASLTKCNATIDTNPSSVSPPLPPQFNDTGDARNKFILKEITGFTNEGDILEKLNNNQFTSFKNKVLASPFDRFESDTGNFKQHHSPHLSGSSNENSISNKCNAGEKPYGVVIASNLKQVVVGSASTTLYAQIFIKKEQQGTDPFLCVYRASMDGNKPATVRDGDLKGIRCFRRKQPDIDKMKLEKTGASDLSKNNFLNHQVTLQYNYSGTDYVDIAKMFEIKTSADLSIAEKYRLKTTQESLNVAKNKGFIEDDIYFEGIKISSARHYCTALNLDCVDNEREIQKICASNALVCNRSIVQTKEDLEQLNSSINNSKYNEFMKLDDPALIIARQSLYRMLEVRKFCLNDILNSCNVINGYNDSDIKNYPEIQTLHPKWNNRKQSSATAISDSATNYLGFNNLVCLKQGVENLILMSPQLVKQKSVSDDVKGKKTTDPNNYVSTTCPSLSQGESCRFAEVYEYKQGGTVSGNTISGGRNDLCVNIGGGSIASPNLVNFCEAKSYPLTNLKYKNFEVNYANKINLIQQGNIRYQSLISKNPPAYSDTADSGENGVDKSHENRRDGVIIAGNTKTANAEFDVSFVDDAGIYGVCNGFWKNKDLTGSPIYQCSSGSAVITLSSASNPACERYSCPAVQYGIKLSYNPDLYENQAMQNGLYNQNGQVIGLDIAEKRGWASWQNFTKTNDFIENVSNNSQCLVGFAKHNTALDSQCFDTISCASANIGNADASKMLTAICPTSSGSANCSDPNNNVYNNYCPNPNDDPCRLPVTHCNQFGYWRFDWSEEFRKVYTQDHFTSSGETVLNECQRIQCSITNLEDKFQDGSSINKTPIRLIKPRCDGLNTMVMVAELNTKIVALQANKYYYLKTSNLGACADANTLRIVKTGSTYNSSVPATYDSIIISGVTDTKKPLNSHLNSNKVTAWYFKITSSPFAIADANLAITTNSNKNTIEHEKILKVWSKIAGFQPDADERALIPAMRNKTIEHAKIGGEKQSANNEDDDYDTTGKCLASLGYREITPEINPQLLCNYQGILQIKQPCVSTCDAVDSLMANTEIHGYSQWAETDNKIKICGSSCTPTTTKIPFSYVSKSTAITPSASQCISGKEPYPYPPFRSLEGVKFELVNTLSSSNLSRHSSSNSSQDVYDANSCSSLNGCIVNFDKANITENVKLLKNSTEYFLYKKDSLGGKEKFAPYDILLGAKYQIKQEASDYLLVLVQPKKLTDDARWQEYNINKRKIFPLLVNQPPSSLCSLNGNVITCQCGLPNQPICPFENVFDKISEGEVVEINLPSALTTDTSNLLKFQKGNPPVATYTNSISIDSSVSGPHLVLKLAKDASDNLQWQSLSGAYAGLKRLSNANPNVNITGCTQQLDPTTGLPSSDYNCNLTFAISTAVSLAKNQEIEINFATTLAPSDGNATNNYIINYNSKPVKKYNSQGNLIADFNYQELSGAYILRAVDEASDGIDYYLLTNAGDFESKIDAGNVVDKYPAPSRTCRYGIGNVWSLPDSACQDTCPGLTQTVPSGGNVETIINDNNFDSRIGSAITEHKIDATGLSLSVGDYLLVDGAVATVGNRDKIAVKVVAKSVNEATLHVIWPALSPNHDVTLILKKDGNTYKIIKGNPTNLPSGNADANNANKPFSAQHYETDDVKESIILYRRCGKNGKWQDPISLCPIAGPAKGGHATLNSILGFVSAANIEPGAESSSTIESVRAKTYFDFSNGSVEGILKQNALLGMPDASDNFYKLFESADPTKNPISEFPVIPDYRIVGDSFSKFGISNNNTSSTPIIVPKNIYAYAMCNYNYVDSSNTDLNNWQYYNFYNTNFGGNDNDGWGTNAKYRCQPSTNNYLNTYKIALNEPTIPGVTPRTTACTQQCNAGIIKRIGRAVDPALSEIDDDFGTSTVNGSDYSTVPDNLTKTYFAPDGTYQKYAKYYQTPAIGSLPAGQSDIYQFHQGRCLVGSDPNKCDRGFAIFSNYTNNNYLTHGSQNAIFNLLSVSGSSDSDVVANIDGSYQCKREASSSDYGVKASNELITLRQRDNDSSPTRTNKYCWGLPKKTGGYYAVPKATCAPSGKWNLANPFDGKKEQSADIFRYSTMVHKGQNIGNHSVSGGIVKEIYLNYGDTKLGQLGNCTSSTDSGNILALCDSAAILMKKDHTGYDDGRWLFDLRDCKGGCNVVNSNEQSCNCWLGIPGFALRADYGTRYKVSFINISPDIEDYALSQFAKLCKTIEQRDQDRCIGFSLPNTGVDNNHHIMTGGASWDGNPAPGQNKNLRIIMWGCPDGLASYDYYKNECKPSSGSTAIYGFNGGGAYGNLPPSCSSFNLATGMLDPTNPSLTSVTLYEDTYKTMTCADGYDISPADVSPKLTCQKPLPSPPEATANFSCQAKQCTSQVVAAFCNQESITGAGCQNQLNSDSTFVGNCSSPGNNAGRQANTIKCDKGVVVYDNYDSGKLCGSFCPYLQQTATSDGFVFQATPTEITVSSNLIVRTGASMSFQCKSGFSLKPDAATSPNINCDANSITYSNARCISNNYCTLSSTTDAGVARVNCNQAGIFCQKDATGAVTNILISQGQSVVVSCSGGFSGTKKYTCSSGSATGTALIQLPSESSCNAINCSVPAGFNTANIFYTSTGGTSTALASTTNNLPYRTTRGGLTCASGYSPSADLGYTCTTAGQTTISGSCNANTCNATLGGSGVSVRSVSFTTGQYTNTGLIYSLLTCNSGYTKSAISGTATNICTMPDTSIQFGSCTPRCEWLSSVTGQWEWVDAITQTRCGSDCATSDGCKKWKCSGGGFGGVYRWDGTSITCP